MQNVLGQIDWKRYELIPTIVQEQGSGEILMLAYSSKESLELSTNTRIAHYFSRSKQRIWQKGEQSGHIQKISEICLDCDDDSLLSSWSRSVWLAIQARKVAFLRVLI